MFKRWAYTFLTDPATNKRRVYASPFSYGHKECPVHEYNKLLKEKIESTKASYLANGYTEEQVREALKPVTSESWKLRLSYGYFYNAVNKSNEVGILELKKTAHDALVNRILYYIQTYQQDPTIQINAAFPMFLQMQKQILVYFRYV